MKKTTLLAVLAFVFVGSSYAQDVTVDEILDGFFENTGGKENWMNLKGMKMQAKINQGGMEFPLEIVQMADGRQYTKFTFQGNDYYQDVYDGETLWSVNFQSTKPEKSDAETTSNFKLDLNDFPSPFFNYKEKGYTAELMGTETVDGAETYKIKLVQEPRMVDGKEVPDVTFYYFDTEAFILIAQESEITRGPQAGSIGWNGMSDYDEVGGLYFPFSMTQGIKGGEPQAITFDAIEVDFEVDDNVFKFPGTEGGE